MQVDTYSVHWLSHVLGLDDVSGAWYAFWSGFGADLGEVAILTGLYSVYHRHRCHVHRCWRLARRHVEGTTLVTCQRHHPKDAPTAEVVEQEWAASNED